MLALSPNSIATTGRGSTGVGLTAAVVVDKDTGKRHLEAGAMVLGDRGIVCIDEFDKMSEIDRVAIHEVMEQQTVTIAKAGIHVSLNARCSVLAAANPIYGEYQKNLPANKNIGLPDSLLSRFDLVFIVLDDNDPEKDRLIADRVIKNHMFPSETPSVNTAYDEKIIEPDLGDDEHLESLVYEKYNALLHGSSRKKDILTRNFVKKYLSYAKKTANPVLSNEAKSYISEAWTRLRGSEDEEFRRSSAVSITVRTLESLIRLSTSHAKARLSDVITRKDCEVAFGLLNYALFNDNFLDDDEVIEEVTTVRTQKKPADKPKVEIQEEDENVILTRSKKRSRRGKLNEDEEAVIEAEPKEEGSISHEQKKFVHHIIRENKDSNDMISLDKLWEITSKIKNVEKYVKNKTELLDIIISSENDGRLVYSQENKTITIV